MNALRFVERETEFVPFAGGLDTQTPPLFLQAGYARSAQNFECGILRGYTRIPGYERVDGRPAPSTATYQVLSATVTGAYTAGMRLNGASSGASALIVSGTSDYLVLIDVTGAFSVNEDITITNTLSETLVIGSTTGTNVAEGAPSPLLNAIYKNAAADVFRNRIAAVPGRGPVRGVWFYNDVLYAFRDTTDALNSGFYKWSTGGWVAIALGRELSFNTGATEVLDGDTVTGATSGAQAVVSRVALESGSWDGGDAAGRFILQAQTGSFLSEDLNVGTTLSVAAVTANSTEITLLPGGRYEFENANFRGLATSKRMYGVDGVNRGFEFDGVAFVPITTGMVLDQPTHLTIHKNHLFYSFAGSVQHSGLAQPYSWTLLTGAGELAQGDLITGFLRQVGSSDGGALLISSRSRLSILYGTSAQDWNLVNYQDELGAYPYTLQRVSETLMLDDRGVQSLTAAQIYGNFQNATVSQRIQSWLNNERSKAIASCVCRDKNQYRLFFSDGYALYVTFASAQSGGGVTQVRGMMPQLFTHPVACVCSASTVGGSEVLFFGGQDGFVYQMERGTSFDGEPIEYFLDLAFDHQKRPRQRKLYKHAQFEVAGDGYAQFDVSYELGYNAADISQPGSTSLVSEFAAPQWDVFVWDEFVWDGFTLAPSNMGLDGTAENLSLKIRGQSDFVSAFTLSGVLIDFSQRRKLR